MSGLVVHEPIPFRVAAPDVPIRAECRSPSGGSCEFEVWIAWDHDEYYLPIGSSTNGKLDIVADLSGYRGTEGEVYFRATFSTGDSASVKRYIFVERSTALDRVTRVDGEILDTDGDRILYRRIEEETGHRYFVRSLEDGSIVELSAPGDLELLAVHDGVSETLLLTDQPENIEMSYQIEEGWVAYYWSLPREPFGRSRWLWVSHVHGTPVQLADSDVRTLEGVGINGSVVTSDFAWFRLRSPTSAAIEFSGIPNGFGEEWYPQRVAPSVRHLDGTWFFLIGDSLFEVRP